MFLKDVAYAYMYVHTANFRTLQSAWLAGKFLEPFFAKVMKLTVRPKPRAIASQLAVCVYQCSGRVTTGLVCCDIAACVG